MKRAPIFIFCIVCSGFSQDVRQNLPAIPKYDVVRANTPIVVDGKLDDEAWKSARTLELMFPWEQAGAKQKTVARLMWDAKYLYVGYDCEDADIVAHYMNRDDPTYKDDAVEVFINPKPSQLFYYGFELNARATLYDYFMAWPTGVHMTRLNHEGVQLATHLNGTLNVTGDKDNGWSLEIAIPWESFQELGAKGAPGPGTMWRINVNRWDGVEPKRRLSVWSDSGMVKPNPHNPNRFGEITFR